MRLFCLRRALLSAGLTLCVWSPIAPPRAARAQEAPPEATPVTNAPAKDSPVPIPEQPTNAPTTQTGAAPVATVAARPAPSPEERRQQTEEKLRALMANLGIAAAPTQDAIIEYLAADELERAGVREAEKRLLAGLRRDVPPERMRDLLSNYRAAIETDKANRAAAQRRLDARVGYSLDAKLEATLWVMGVLGEGASKLPTSALAAPTPGQTPDETAPVYGPLRIPNFGARGEIVGTVTAKGIEPDGGHWLEIRDDSGASERYSALWRDDLKALDPPMEKQLAATPLSARVRVQWAWQDKRRALQLQPEDAAKDVTKIPTP